MSGRSSGQPTLEQIAARAGVGRGTASRVINESAHVSERSRQAVLAAIEELGYVPNQAARSLVRSRTGHRLDDQVERAFEVTGVHRRDDVG